MTGARGQPDCPLPAAWGLVTSSSRDLPLGTVPRSPPGELVPVCQDSPWLPSCPREPPEPPGKGSIFPRAPTESHLWPFGPSRLNGLRRPPPPAGRRTLVAQPVCSERPRPSLTPISGVGTRSTFAARNRYTSLSPSVRGNWLLPHLLNFAG